MLYISFGVILLITATVAVFLWGKFLKSEKKKVCNPPDSIVHRNIVAIGGSLEKEPRCPVCKGKNPRTQAHCSLCGFYLYYVPNDSTIVAYRYYIPSVREVSQYARRERFIVNAKK